MAASVVGIGMVGKTVKSSPTISSSRSSSLHDPSVVAPSSSYSDSNNSAKGPSLYVKNEENTISLLPELSPLSSSSEKQLALSSSQGREASPAPSLSDAHEDETDIALSQLKELDIAIEVRKVTKIDGRKTRWIEYRKKRGGPGNTLLKQEEDEEEEEEEIEVVPDSIEKIKRKVKNKRTSNEKIPLDINENPSPIKTEVIECEKNLNQSTYKSEKTVGNNCNNNNIISSTKMKVESPDSAASPLGTNNVLETMKQHFLQGTVNVPEVPTNGVKAKGNKKVKAVNGSSAIAESMPKRKTGRQPTRSKRSDNLKSASKASTPPANKTEDKSCDNSPLTNSPPLSSAVNGSENSVKKFESSSGIQVQSAGEFYSKRNFLTRGLREVRKSESGSESGSSSPEKAATPSSTCPSTPLPVSPIPHTISSLDIFSSFNKSSSFNDDDSAQNLSSDNNNIFPKKKRSVKLRMTKKVKTDVTKKSHGHMSIKKAFKKIRDAEDVEKSADNSSVNNEVVFRKKRGGRSKCKSIATEEDQSSFNSKKTSTVVVDVHNTMNGEPQTVISSSSALQKRKKSPAKRTTDLTENLSAKANGVSSLDNQLSSPLKLFLSDSSDSPMKSPCASNNSPISTVNNSSSIKNGSALNEEIRKDNVLSRESLDIKPCVDSIITVTPNSLPSSGKGKNIVKSSLKYPTTHYRPIAMKPPPKNSVPSPKNSSGSTIIVSTSEAIRKANKESKQPIEKREASAVHSGSITRTLPISKPAILPKGTKPNNEKMKNRSINDIIAKLQHSTTNTPNETNANAVANKSNTGIDIQQHSTNGNVPVSVENVKKKQTESDAPENPTSKPKEKVPRFLKQLFQDEGVQNMLRSVNEENTTVTDGLANDSGSHKLRPKKPNENPTADSPEPDESIFANAKRKKRCNEVDNLFLDEGTLNLLTSLDSGSRRNIGAEETGSDTSSSKSIKLHRPNSNLPENSENDASRKRRLSGSASSSFLLNYAKKPKSVVNT